MAKQCCTCKEFKVPEAFTTDGSKKDGLSKQCKSCYATRQQRYRENKRAKVTADVRQIRSRWLTDSYLCF